MADFLSKNSTHDNAPIGVFDSGYGGLTVLREILHRMPQENVIFVGDSARCPYGPREMSEVRDFALQICSYLVDRGCKLIVIACNTATAAGLKEAQRRFDIPIIGVVEPGARAAVHMTRTRQVGVIATEGTVKSSAYETAIKNIDAGINVIQVATPAFVDIAEAGLQTQRNAGLGKDIIWDDYRDIAQESLSAFHQSSIDTLVLGCTHFPIIKPLIEGAIDDHIMLVSSAEETSRDVLSILERRHALANGDAKAVHEFLTTSQNVDEFASVGSIILNENISSAKTIQLP